MNSERVLGDEFTLEGGDGRYHRTIGSEWVNNGDLVFGGYTSALCFAAAVRESPHPAICSGHVVFLEAVKPGRIDLEVRALRAGRSVAAMRVEIIQNGRRASVCHSWLRQTPTAPTALGTIAGWSGPEDAAGIPWLSDMYIFNRWFDNRGVDYPSGSKQFAVDGKRSVDLWMRPKGRQLPPGTLTQLFDVLVADAHIGDGSLRGHQVPECDPDALVSLDLAIQWTPVLHRTGWRRIQSASPPAAEGCTAACVATIYDAAGAVCATAAQQTWDVQRRPAKVGSLP